MKVIHILLCRVFKLACIMVLLGVYSQVSFAQGVSRGVSSTFTINFIDSRFPCPEGTTRQSFDVANDAYNCVGFAAGTFETMVEADEAFEDFELACENLSGTVFGSSSVVSSSGEIIGFGANGSCTDISAEVGGVVSCPTDVLDQNFSSRTFSEQNRTADELVCITFPSPEDLADIENLCTSLLGDVVNTGSSFSTTCSFPAVAPTNPLVCPDGFRAYRSTAEVLNCIATPQSDSASSVQTMVDAANQTCTDAVGVFASTEIGEIQISQGFGGLRGKQLGPIQAQPQGAVVSVPVTSSGLFGANVTCAIDQTAASGTEPADDSAEEPAEEPASFSPFVFTRVIRACDATCTEDLELVRECINGEVGEPGCEGSLTMLETLDCNTGSAGLCPAEVQPGLTPDGFQVESLSGALLILLGEEEQDINTNLSPVPGSGSLDISPAEPD